MVCGGMDRGCIATDYQGHGLDEIWVLSWLREDVPTAIWDNHVPACKELIRLAADHDHLPMPRVDFLRKVGGGDV